MRKGRKNNDVTSFPSTFCSSVVVNLNKVNQLPTSLNISSTHTTPATHPLWYRESPPAKPTKLIKLSTLVAFQVTIPMSFLEIDSGSSVHSHDLIAPRVLQTPDALKCDVEAPRESQVSVRIATRAEKVPVEPPGYEVVAEGGWNAVFDVIKGRFRRGTQKKSVGEVLTVRSESRR
jgi:hypothetical protein